MNTHNFFFFNNNIGEEWGKNQLLLTFGSLLEDSRHPQVFVHLLMFQNVQKIFIEGSLVVELLRFLSCQFLSYKLSS